MALADSHSTTLATHVRIPRANRERVKAQISLRIQEYLNQQGSTVKWLADRSGLDRGTILRILSRLSFPTEKSLRRLAAVIGPDILTDAGYSLDPPPDQIEITVEKVYFCNLKDRELVFLLGHLAGMHPKVQQIVKYILREDYRQLCEKVGSVGSSQTSRGIL